MPERPAVPVGADGYVLLSPHGARLVLLALDVLGRQVAAADGRPPTGDLAQLRRTVGEAAAAGTAPGTIAGPWPQLVATSAERLTTVEAAAVLGVTERAVRKAAAAGRFGATRHGRTWSLDAAAVRRAARRQPWAPTAADPSSASC